MKPKVLASITTIHAAFLYEAVTVSAQCQPGAYRCNPDIATQIDVCDVGSQWVALPPCPQSTHCGYINQIPYCLNGPAPVVHECDPGAVRCAASLSGVETCNNQGRWATTTTCVSPERCFATGTPHCAAPCTPGTFQCTASGLGWQRCSSDQQWIDTGACGTNQHCVYGTPPSCIDNAQPECQQGNTYCYIRTTTTGGRGWAVYGCNTHDHLVPLTDCPAGWTCTTTKTAADTRAQCVPPSVPAACVPKLVLTDLAFGIINTANELKFNFANTVDPPPSGSQFCAVPNPDGKISGAVEVGKVYDCGRGVQYRVLDYSVNAIGMDIFVSYTCQGTKYGALVASHLLGWECTYVWRGLLCGKTGVQYRIDPDFTGPLDSNGCLPLPVGDSIKLICPGTWA
ncbi:hypothetical protein B0T19DRAFT_469808 [Cercophora scortea]|uniref:Uncharacterized protein n=1 Tax=Cercophora scortea TaxID=314031 RepID=A0AAE0I2H1_9PEZI|nr:hypothetical protein B0T19DRAFT_469808 [Cercophora scortea]